MRIFIRKLTLVSLLVIFAVSLTLPCHAAEENTPYDIADKSFDEIISDFMAEYGLTEENFALGWYNCGTGETRYINGEAYFVAGSMYKLPLAMNFIRKFADGTFAPNDLTDGYQLTILIDLAIRYSDNDAADRLRRYYSPSFMTYRYDLVYYSDVDKETLPYVFYADNCLSPHIMLDTLKALYNDQEFYAQVIDNMLLAHPDQYFRKDQGEYEIAHKYGFYDNALSDCAIVYTPTPFLLVAFTDGVWNAENALSDLMQRMIAYSLRCDSEAALREEEPEATPMPVPTETPAPTPLPTPQPTLSPVPTALPIIETEAAEFSVTPVLIAAAAVILALGIFIAVRRKKSKKTK